MDSITTLIVEDEPMLAEILVDTIKIFPQFSIVGIADKLESAKKQIRLYQPQLILLDNFLPDGKGIDLIRHTISTKLHGANYFHYRRQSYGYHQRCLTHGRIRLPD